MTLQRDRDADRSLQPIGLPNTKRRSRDEKKSPAIGAWASFKAAYGATAAAVRQT